MIPRILDSLKPISDKVAYFILLLLFIISCSEFPPLAPFDNESKLYLYQNIPLYLFKGTNENVFISSSVTSRFGNGIYSVTFSVINPVGIISNYVVKPQNFPPSTNFYVNVKFSTNGIYNFKTTSIDRYSFTNTITATRTVNFDVTDGHFIMEEIIKSLIHSPTNEYDIISYKTNSNDWPGTNTISSNVDVLIIYKISLTNSGLTNKLGYGIDLQESNNEKFNQAKKDAINKTGICSNSTMKLRNGYLFIPPQYSFENLKAIIKNARDSNWPDKNR